MVRLYSLLTYQKGEHEDLDKKWEQFRTIHVFKGLGFSEALIREEQDTLLKIWRIKKLRPWKLTFGDVSTWVKLSERIVDYRKRVQRGNARLRNSRARKKLKAAARQGDDAAKEKIESIKKSKREYMSKVRSKKRKDSSSS